MTLLLTLCADTACPVRTHCQRSPSAGAVSNRYTSWFLSSPRTLQGCVMFEGKPGDTPWPTFTSLAGVLQAQ